MNTGDTRFDAVPAAAFGRTRAPRGAYGAQLKTRDEYIATCVLPDGAVTRSRDIRHVVSGTFAGKTRNWKYQQ